MKKGRIYSDPSILADVINNWDRNDIKVLFDSLSAFESCLSPHHMQDCYRNMSLVLGVGIPDVLAADLNGQALVMSTRGIKIVSLDSIVMKYI